MKTLSLSLVMAFLLSTAACVTPSYQKRAYGGGWENRIIGNMQLAGSPKEHPVYQVDYQANKEAYLFPGRLMAVYGFYRCAELAMELKKPYFILNGIPRFVMDLEQPYDPFKADYPEMTYAAYSESFTIIPFQNKEDALQGAQSVKMKHVHYAPKVIEQYKPYITGEKEVEK